MRNALSRTVTVGLKYPVHTLTIYLTLLCLILSGFILTACLDNALFLAAGLTVIVWCVVGVTICVWLLIKSLAGDE